jgi:hypothetical protein
MEAKMENESRPLTIFTYDDGEFGVKYAGDMAAVATFDTRAEAEAFIAECDRINSGGDADMEAFLAECDRVLAGKKF